jgi:GH43 family beta-xylosidase
MSTTAGSGQPWTRPIAVAFSIYICLLCSTAARVNAQAPYTNPVIGDPSHVEHELADPFVLKWNGQYFIYFSGSPIVAYHSTDLVHWDLVGPVLQASDRPDAWNQSDIWAPEVVYHNGKFYMYYTASRKSDDWRVGEMARRIGVAVSDSPRGPFIDSGQPVTPGWGIDPTVFRDPDGGAEYLFYSYLYEPQFPGAGIVADRLTSWNTVAGQPSHVTRGSEAWEDKDGDPNDSSLRYTNEAPTVIKRHGHYYMMYSAGSWDLPTYALAYATSDTPPSGRMDGPGWKKVVPPILRSTPLVDAPGHNALVKAPNNVDDICIHHARVVPFLDPWNRLPFVDRLYWNHDRMFMQQPSLADLPAPNRPIFSSYGNGNGNDGHIAADYGRGKTMHVTPQVGPYTHFVYEVNLRMLPKEPAPVAREASVGREEEPGAGALVFYQDEDNWVRASIESKVVALRARIAGKNLSPVTREFPPGFVPEAFHQLLITRNGGRVEVQLDGVKMLAETYNLGGKSGAFGTFSVQTPVEFGSQALTPFYEDTFDSPDAIESWSTSPSSNWLVQEGALHQVGGGGNRVIALKGDSADNYEFSASLLWRDNDSLASRAGVVAAADQPGAELVLAGFDRNSWPFARFWVQHVLGNEVRDSFSVGLPRGFQYDAYHTIRVSKQGSAFTFFLDGQEIADARFSIGISKPGLFTEGVRAAFDDVSMTHRVVPQNLIMDASLESEQWDGRVPSKENPWKFSGTARANYCCAHSGLRRLVIESGGGTAQQTIPGLAPGRYTLHAWVLSTAGAQATLTVDDFGGTPVHASAEGTQWHRISVDFTVPEGHSSATLSMSAPAQADSKGYVAADDFYLFQQ